MQQIDFTWKIGGEAGYGIMTAGLVFAKVFSRIGYNIFTTNDFPSLIRGGHNTFTVRISTQPVQAYTSKVNLLIAFNKETIILHKNELAENGAVVYDEKIQLELPEKNNKNFFAVPILDTAQKAGEAKVMMNLVAVGASLALLGNNFTVLSELIGDIFKKKGEKIIKSNIEAAKAGYDYIKQKYRPMYNFPKLAEIDNMLINGNEALSLGAIKAGCKFVSMYPMTPSSPILQFMAEHQNEHHILVKQTEDEISAINMAIGASFAGVRAMTATSGGGFSLMVEALGLAGMTETPIVIVNGQRPGPATGLPTKTEQGDLRFVTHAAQGEFPRIILAPGDVEECFYETIRAFNLAEKYQCPVIILTDKYLADNMKTTKKFDYGLKIERYSMTNVLKKLNTQEFFKRYYFTETGISPRVLPGQADGMHLSAGDEHNETGFLIDDSDARMKMMDKRFKKLEELKNELPQPKLHGPTDAQTTIISWGSTKGQVLEAMEMLRKDKITVNFLHFMYIHPFPSEKAKEVLDKAKTKIIVEQNKTAQLAGIIREHTGIAIEHKILKYDGMPFVSNELYKKIKMLIK